MHDKMDERRELCYNPEDKVWKGTGMFMKRTGVFRQMGRIVTGTILAAVLLQGCGAKDDTLEKDLLIGVKKGIKVVNENTADKQIAYEPCTLQFSWWGEETINPQMQQAVECFEAAYPGIHVEASARQGENREEELLEQLLGGTASDINQIRWEWLQEYSADGSLFYDLYKAYEVLELGAFGQEYLNLCTIGEELQAIPASVTGRVFLFDATLFEQAGQTVPQTLQELVDAGEAFQSQLGDNYYPLALNTADRMALLVYYLESRYGKDWMVNGVLQYDVEEVEKGMEFLVMLEEQHVIPTLQKMKDADTMSRAAGWNNGFYGGVFLLDTELQQYRESLSDGHRLAVGARLKDLGIYQGGHVQVACAYAVSESCEHPREAALFLNFLLNCEEGIAAISDTQGIPLSRIARAYGKEQGMWDSTAWEANTRVLEADFRATPELMEGLQDASVYAGVMSGLSYGDYNAREAAQLLMDGFESF